MKHKIIKNDKREYIRCLKDPVYFFNKYCKVYNKVTGEYVNLKITHKQYERFIKFKNSQNFRQTR